VAAVHKEIFLWGLRKEVICALSKGKEGNVGEGGRGGGVLLRKRPKRMKKAKRV